MADAYLLEGNTDSLLLEDGSGVLLEETSALVGRVTAQFAAAITGGSYARAIVAQALDPATLLVLSDLSTVVLDGSVEVRAKNDIRRSLTMTVANDGGTFTPRLVSDPFWMNNPLRLWWRMLYQDGSTEDVPLGTFLVNKTWMRLEAGRAVIDVDAVDFGKKLQYTKLLSVATYAAGSTLLAALNDLLARAGVGAAQRDIDPSIGATLLHAAPAADLNIARGTAIADCLAMLFDDYGLTGGFDPLGTYVIRPTADPSTIPSTFTFGETDPLVTAVEGGYEDSLDIANHVIVASTDATIQPILAEAKDNNTTSPTYVGGSFGDRLYEYDADWIQTQAQGNTAATSILYRKLGDSRKADITSGPRPELDALDVGTITSPFLNVAGVKYQVDLISIPLAAGVQRTSLTEVRALP